MKVFITQPYCSKIEPWEVNRLSYIRQTVAKAATTYPELSFIELSNTPESADIIVMLESCRLKGLDYISELNREAVIHLKPFRVYTLNYEDRPFGLLPGLYSSLEPHNFNPQYHLSWPHLDCPNTLVNEYLAEGEKFSERSSLLFTFSGSCSHPIRRKLFSAYSNNSNLYHVVEVDKWFNHDESEKFSYMQDILQSKYVLCPRGHASYSHRIFETIILGKVPVVIADDWIPFSISETDYYIRVREADILSIPAILQEMESGYEDRVKMVNLIRNKYFLNSKKYAVAIAQLIDLHSRIDSGISYNLLVQNFLSTLKMSTFKKNKATSSEKHSTNQQ